MYYVVRKNIMMPNGNPKIYTYRCQSIRDDYEVINLVNGEASFRIGSFQEYVWSEREAISKLKKLFPNIKRIKNIKSLEGLDHAREKYVFKD